MILLKGKFWGVSINEKDRFKSQLICKSVMSLVRWRKEVAWKEGVTISIIWKRIQRVPFAHSMEEGNYSGHPSLKWKITLFYFLLSVSSIDSKFNVTSATLGQLAGWANYFKKERYPFLLNSQRMHDLSNKARNRNLLIDKSCLFTKNF